MSKKFIVRFLEKGAKASNKNAWKTLPYSTPVYQRRESAEAYAEDMKTRAYITEKYDDVKVFEITTPEPFVFEFWRENQYDEDYQRVGKKTIMAKTKKEAFEQAQKIAEEYDAHHYTLVFPLPKSKK